MLSTKQKIRQALASSNGFVDLQSVMVGTVISGIVAGTAIVGLIGFTNMMNDDNSRTTVKTLSIGLESFYTDKDRYPATLAELADGKYVPQSYKSIPTSELCYVPSTTDAPYPQTYTATGKSTTGKLFEINEETKEPGQVLAYPVVTTCK